MEGRLSRGAPHRPRQDSTADRGSRGSLSASAAGASDEHVSLLRTVRMISTTALTAYESSIELSLQFLRCNTSQPGHEQL